MAGTLTIAGLSAGENVGQRVLGPLSIVGSSAVGETLSVALTTGDNTLSVPSGAVACLIVPPTNNAVVLKVRTSLNSGDAGLPLNTGALPFVYPFPATPPTTLIVNAASSVASGFSVAFI